MQFIISDLALAKKLADEEAGKKIEAAKKADAEAKKAAAYKRAGELAKKAAGKKDETKKASKKVAFSDEEPVRPRSSRVETTRQTASEFDTIEIGDSETTETEGDSDPMEVRNVSIDKLNDFNPSHNTTYSCPCNQQLPKGERLWLCWTTSFRTP